MHTIFGRYYAILIIGVLAFSVLIVFVSAVISKRRAKMEKSELATYIVLIAWASLILGFFLAKF